jgi:hypothetical protein
MLDNSHLKNIVRTIMEEKKKAEPAGAALAAKRQKETTAKVRQAIHDQMPAGAGDKIHAQLINRYTELRDHVAKVMEHEGVSPLVKARLRSSRALSRLDDVLKHLTNDEK